MRSLTVIGTHKPPSTHAPTYTHARADEHRHTRTHGHGHTSAWQVVPLFFCLAALIHLTMIQAKSDPSMPLTFACERRIEGANRWLPRGAASPVHDVARQGLDGSADSLCKLHGCTSVRHEVPAYCHHAHIRAASAISEHFCTPCAGSAALRSLALAFSQSCSFVRF